ncbi:MAG: recombination mediator RecR [Bdellovibrionales bacterium]|jgi:recombination protein RecR|nr:recombination mediator RecR [Bdellovibrionales bacterium]
MKLPDSITEVMSYLSKLPGVGEKSALRYTLFLTRLENEMIKEFSNSISSLAEIKKCESCGFFCEEYKCSICLDENRGEFKTICVVEGISDLMAIEKSGHYRGRYHVLGGVLNPLLGIGPQELHMEKLFQRISSEKIQDLVLAINPSVEGDATCSYIRDQISPDVKAERIGFGMPMGGSLEYLDSLTISKALENRTSF